MSDIVETVAILRHLRRGYWRTFVKWAVVMVGSQLLERRAEALWEPLGWACYLVGLAAFISATFAISVAIFRSDKWLLEDFTRQTGYPPRGGDPYAYKGDPSDVFARIRHSESMAEQVKSDLNAVSGVEPLSELPESVPQGKALVHSSTSARFWLQKLPAERYQIVLVACDCDFAPELGTHYITRAPD